MKTWFIIGVLSCGGVGFASLAKGEPEPSSWHQRQQMQLQLDHLRMQRLELQRYLVEMRPAAMEESWVAMGRSCGASDWFLRYRVFDAVVAAEFEQELSRLCSGALAQMQRWNSGVYRQRLWQQLERRQGRRVAWATQGSGLEQQCYEDWLLAQPAVDWSGWQSCDELAVQRPQLQIRLPSGLTGLVVAAPVDHEGKGFRSRCIRAQRDLAASQALDSSIGALMSELAAGLGSPALSTAAGYRRYEKKRRKLDRLLEQQQALYNHDHFQLPIEVRFQWSLPEGDWQIEAVRMGEEPWQVEGSPLLPGLEFRDEGLQWTQSLTMHQLCQGSGAVTLKVKLDEDCLGCTQVHLLMGRGILEQSIRHFD